MQKTHTCIVCHSTNLLERWCITSPFISSYVLKTKPKVTIYCECQNCGIHFFSERFTEAELKQLYKDYRKNDYFIQRHNFEPWYTKEINFSIGNRPEELTQRKLRVKNYIQMLCGNVKFQTVLDYGGDRGQFIPDQLFQEKIVYDISGVEVEKDVTSIQNLSKIEGKFIDIILLAHVLEHASQPQDILSECLKVGQKGRTYLYIEVPDEQNRFYTMLPSKIYYKFLSFLVQFPNILLFTDFYSTLFRHFWNIIPPLGFIKLHEHINFYNIKSLTTLINQSGFEVIDCRKSKRSKIEKSVIMCLARRTN